MPEPPIEEIVIPGIRTKFKYGLRRPWGGERNGEIFKDRFFVLAEVLNISTDMLPPGDKDWTVSIEYKANNDAEIKFIKDAHIYYESMSKKYILSYVLQSGLATNMEIILPPKGGYRKIRKATKKLRRNRRCYTRNK